MRVSKTKKIIFEKKQQQREAIVTRWDTLTIKTILNLIKISFKSWQNKKEYNTYCLNL